ncbi:MAG: hypothetical protein WC756_11000 [Taibaiella sp.]|jgi:hypothetical protein
MKIIIKEMVLFWDMDLEYIYTSKSLRDAACGKFSPTFLNHETLCYTHFIKPVIPLSVVYCPSSISSDVRVRQRSIRTTSYLRVLHIRAWRLAAGNKEILA